MFVFIPIQQLKYYYIVVCNGSEQPVSSQGDCGRSTDGDLGGYWRLRRSKERTTRTSTGTCIDACMHMDMMYGPGAVYQNL